MTSRLGTGKPLSFFVSVVALKRLSIKNVSPSGYKFSILTNNRRFFLIGHFLSIGSGMEKFSKKKKTT